MSNSKQGVGIQSYTFSLITLLTIGVSVSTCTKQATPTPIPEAISFDQVVADAKAGKIALIKYAINSDVLTVCYDANCANVKVSSSLVGNKSLHTLLLQAGVPEDKMPTIEVTISGPSQLPHPVPPTPIAETIPFSQVVADAKSVFRN